MPSEYSFDADAFELRRGDQAIAMEPQALSVAAYLIEHRHRLISKEELLDEIWGDRFVSESALSTRIKQIRRAFDDNGVDQRVVKTVHGKGYRFVGEIALTSSVPTTEAAVSSPLPVAHHNLPHPRTEMLGRATELEQTVESISNHRLTTMVGIGGVGKTTLAIAAGHAVCDSFDHGVWLVDLVPVTDEGQMLRAIARAAGLSLGSGSAVDQISDIIAEREMLFVLDNCEHILDAAVDVVDRLLDASIAPRFLVTSREPLGLVDEARVVIGALPATIDGGPAVEMLEACAARFGVALDGDDRSRAAAVCCRLDGLPLAIELAAAQLRHLSIEDLASRLEADLGLLAWPRRAGRHASLTSVLDAAWASISNSEREVLRQLAPCPGTLSVHDIVEIMGQTDGATLAALARLVDCSLLVRSTEDGRYRMLETVRLYASDTDDDDQRLARRSRVAAWSAEHLGRDVASHSLDFGLTMWCRAHDDVLDVAEVHLAEFDRPGDAAMLLCAQSLTAHLDDGSRATELLHRIDGYLAQLTDPEMHARLHIAGAFAAMAARDPGALASHGVAAVEAADRAGDPSIRAIARVLRSWSALRDPALAIALVSEAATIADEAGARRVFDLAEGYLAWQLAVQGRHSEAIGVAEAVIARAPADAGYETYCAAVALATCQVLRDPAQALRICQSHLAAPPVTSMAANEFLVASAHAAAGSIADASRIALGVHRRLERSGQRSLPDLLVPAAILARTMGDTDRSRVFVSGIRRSERPTQSLQMTSLYKELRSDVHDGFTDHEEAGRAGDIGDDALRWLEALA